MRIVQDLPESVWRRFVDENPRGNIFHTPEMFQVFARAQGYCPTLWAAVDATGAPFALLVTVQVTIASGLLRRFTTRAVAYGGALCSESPEGLRGLDLLLQTYQRQQRSAPLFTELRHMSDPTDLQPALVNNRFVYEDHLNYLIDLDREPEAILRGISKRTRKQIRHELREGDVVIEEVAQGQQVGLVYELLQKTYGAVKIPLADRSLFEAAFDILRPRGMVRFLLARIGDRYAAGSVELLYRDTILGWYGASDRSLSRHSPNEMLMWHILGWGAENGYKTYDFGGAGRPNERYGVRDFKAKFGGDLVCYGRNTCVHSPHLLRLMRLAYQIYRRWA